ncbi:MAG TPA: hypothetical protein DCS17_07540 [Flavobacterium sp.]|nr:hypothetical protein [Flavobacterium sp.]
MISVCFSFSIDLVVNKSEISLMFSISLALQWIAITSRAEGVNKSFAPTEAHRAMVLGCTLNSVTSLPHKRKSVLTRSEMLCLRIFILFFILIVNN